MSPSHRAFARLRVRWFALVTMLLLAGCATTVDWPSRVGTYTYDEAVKELGPPDKSATTTDGILVAEWLVRAPQTRAGVGTADGMMLRYHMGYYTYSPSMILNPWDVYTTPGQYLRLTFGPDRTLLSTKRITK